MFNQICDIFKLPIYRTVIPVYFFDRPVDYWYHSDILPRFYPVKPLKAVVRNTSGLSGHASSSQYW